MDINQLQEIVKKKINQNIKCEKIDIEDKTFLHQKHKTFEQISTSNGICIFSNLATGRTWSSIGNSI